MSQTTYIAVRTRTRIRTRTRTRVGVVFSALFLSAVATVAGSVTALGHGTAVPTASGSMPCTMCGG
ncbi:hypothetical protein KGQ20_36860 [Catenulispora sp. NF23]|uniref:Uncharacterized protein n=1 Tax=Catenulispora pinistramenti TaxID=2705254 RepID=A0ABS5L620_9ACTN|nr:hypothetical protein [Catenulispora pinistramenti]MBS2538336.1 hypothetical protein [Catenulispora pinistramenti]MBS2553786.1 hypothetical protein [Catenulispora pinistramenti]